MYLTNTGHTHLEGIYYCSKALIRVAVQLGDFPEPREMLPQEWLVVQLIRDALHVQGCVVGVGEGLGHGVELGVELGV